MMRSVRFWTQLILALAFLTVFSLLAGWPGFWGALIGSVAVIIFFGSTVAVIGPIATWYPHLSLAFALTFYMTKALVLAALFILLRTREHLDAAVDDHALAITLIASSIGWLISHTIDAVRTRTPTYDLPEVKHDRPDTVGER